MQEKGAAVEAGDCKRQPKQQAEVTTKTDRALAWHEVGDNARPSMIRMHGYLVISMRKVLSEADNVIGHKRRHMYMSHATSTDVSDYVSTTPALEAQDTTIYHYIYIYI